MWQEEMILIIVSILLVVCGNFLHIKIKCTYEFILDGKHFALIELSVLRFRVFRRKINVAKKPQSLFDLSLKNVFRIWQKEKNKLKDKLIVQHFSHVTVIGTSEAISTGIATAALLAFKESMMLFLFHYAKVACKPLIAVHPVYQGEALQTKIEFSVKVRLIHAFRLFLRMKKTFRE